MVSKKWANPRRSTEARGNEPSAFPFFTRFGALYFVSAGAAGDRDGRGFDYLLECGQIFDTDGGDLTRCVDSKNMNDWG